MANLQKYNSIVPVQRIGNDSIYGTGFHGNVVIAANTNLSQDMYYSNLTINSGVHLNTNGFRVFVKNTLTVNGSIGIYAGTTVSTATLAGTPAVATSTTKSIGGSAAGTTYTASQISSTLMQDLSNAVFGGYILPDSTINLISGGASGENGLAGTVTNATAGSGATSGGAGGAGGAGGLPSRNAGAPGGPGTSGTAGTSGSNGIAGTTPPAASAGAGGRGGGVVLVIAKSIIGTGSLLSQASNATAGGSAATGTGATVGVAGSAGSAGSAAPVSEYLNHWRANEVDYKGGDGTHGAHATAPAPGLPHFTAHLVGNYSALVHRQPIYYTDHTVSPVHPANAHTGHNGHAGPDHHAGVPAASSYFHVNSVNHTNGGPHTAVPSGGAFAHYYFHLNPSHHHGRHHHEADHHNYSVHDIKHGGYHEGCCVAAHRGRHYADRNYDHGVQRQLGYEAHFNTANFPGGTAGAAGTAGLKGSDGTNGSTTAGTNGKSGGGGGIIMITDTAIAGTLSVSTSGGGLSSVNGSAGMQITVLNQ